MAATCDSFMLLIKQLSMDLQDYNTSLHGFLAVVGAWYTFRWASKIGCFLVNSTINITRFLKSKNFVKAYGRWAVITGCTSGIGNTLANELAGKGLNIVLIARNSESLQEKARFIENFYGVHTLTIVHDFNLNSPDLMNTIADVLNRLDVGILVNNVGIHYDYPMEFSVLNEERAHSMVQVNISSVVAMTRIVLPGMVNRRRGLIVNLSSAAGSLPVPFVSLYSACKAFVTRFSQSLYEEVCSHNVHVQSLVPYYISTKMVKYSTLLQKSRIFTPSPEIYAKHAVRTFGDYRVNTGYFPHTAQVWLQQASPQFVSRIFAYWFHRYLCYEGRIWRKDQ